MTRTVVDAELRVFEPGNTSTSPSDADATIPDTDIGYVNIENRLQSVKDTAKIELDNDGASYTDSVDIGDRVQFRTRLEGESSLSHRWTGMVRPMSHTVTGPASQDLELTLEDFVFAVFSMRFTTESFDEVQVSGTSSSIVDTLLRENASEIGTSRVDTVTRGLSVQYQRTNLLEAFRRIREQTPVVMASDGVDFVFTERSSLSTEFELDSSDRIGEWSHEETDKNMANEVLIDGVRDTGLDVEQTSYDSTERVTDSNRRTQQVNVRKGEIAGVSINVDPYDPDDALVVRLQANDSGSPKAPGNKNSDLARSKIPASEVTDGMNYVPMPENNLPNPDPHVLIESDGSGGHDVRYDSSTNETAYRIFYYYPIVVGARSNSSITQYRRREGRYRRESVVGESEGENVVQGIIARRQTPGGEVSFTADSLRAHNVRPREVIDVDESTVDANGNYVVTSVVDTYDGLRLRTEVTAKTRENV